MPEFVPASELVPVPEFVRPKPKLEVELVPSTCWWSNVRSQVTKAQWEKCKAFVRDRVTKTRGYASCEICGGRGEKWPIECHEIWSYEGGIQRLEGLIALCPTCHKAKHIGRTMEVEPESVRMSVIFKLMQVNGWGHMQTMEHIDEAFAIWSIRSMSEWQLDVSYLKEIGVELPQYVWGPGERVAQ